MRVLIAPDKFRGSARASEVAAAIGEVAWEVGWDAIELPFSDGGEGLVDVFGGPNRTTEVHGPLGTMTRAPWRISGGTAVIEMAAASGLELAGGAAHNDPLRADTTGVGELIMTACRTGAKRIIVGLGGSASTDGGLGALDVIVEPARLAGVELVAACDVDITFVDAAARFAPQKGASPAQVRLLERRLVSLAERYRHEYSVDVADLARSGAAGGLAGGLVALGARLESGFDLVADEVDLDAGLEGVDLVITGEGHLDAGSFDGKVVGGIAAAAAACGVPVVAIVGDVDPDVAGRIRTMSLIEHFGEARSLARTLDCVRVAAKECLVR